MRFLNQSRRAVKQTLRQSKIQFQTLYCYKASLHSGRWTSCETRRNDTIACRCLLVMDELLIKGEKLFSKSYHSLETKIIFSLVSFLLHGWSNIILFLMNSCFRNVKRSAWHLEEERCSSWEHQLIWREWMAVWCFLSTVRNIHHSSWLLAWMQRSEIITNGWGKHLYQLELMAASGIAWSFISCVVWQRMGDGGGVYVERKSDR